MRRRAVVGGLLALASAVAAGPAWPQGPAVDGAYADVAAWLFDLYIGQSIRLTLQQAARQRPGADTELARHAPVMARVLERHRAPFASAMTQALREAIGDGAIRDVQARARRTPSDLDEATRQRLVATDQVFRRDHQGVIRAITSDLGLMVAEALSGTAPSPQNVKQ